MSTLIEIQTKGGRPGCSATLIQRSLKPKYLKSPDVMFDDFSSQLLVNQDQNHQSGCLDFAAWTWQLQLQSLPGATCWEGKGRAKAKPTEKIREAALDRAPRYFNCTAWLAAAKCKHVAVWVFNPDPASSRSEGMAIHYVISHFLDSKLKRWHIEFQPL